MSEMDDLRRGIETNFRLNALHTRELGWEMRRELTEVRRELRLVSHSLTLLGDKVETLGENFASGMEQQAVRHEHTLAAINKVLDNSVSLHQTVSDHERRLRALEDRAS